MIEVARQQWAEGQRRLEAERASPRRHQLLLQHARTVTEELRRRLGGSFSLAELAETYGDSDRWIREVVEEASLEGVSPDVTIAADAAFHVYARGARDYVP